MTRTRVLAGLLAGLTLAGLGTAATALGSDDPASTPAPVTVVAQTRAATPADTSRPTTTAPATDAVSADEAGARAVAHSGGGTVSTVEREVEHGRTVWKVDVRRDSLITEAHVDVATGTVTRTKNDDRTGDDRSDGRSDGHGGRHGNDDGPGHDRFDDKGGDR